MTDAAALSAAPANRPLRRGALFWSVVLAAYWIVLFAGTHTRATHAVPTPVFAYDKVVHFGAFFVLATLAMVTARRWTPSVGATTAWTIALVLLAYGAADELTQPLVGRTCSFADWVADAAGVALAIALDRWRRPAATPPPRA